MFRGIVFLALPLAAVLADGNHFGSVNHADIVRPIQTAPVNPGFGFPPASPRGPFQIPHGHRFPGVEPQIPAAIVSNINPGIAAPPVIQTLPMIPAVAFQNITIESSTAASVSAFSIPANTSIVVNKTTIAEPIVASTISSDTEEDFNQVAGETSTVAIVEATKSPKAHGSHGDLHEGKNKSKEKKSGEKKSGEKKSREE